MKHFILVIVAAIFSLRVVAQDVNALITEGEKLEAALNEKAAFEA